MPDLPTDPNLLWRILTSGVRVAGPWQRELSSSSRRDPNGCEVASTWTVEVCVNEHMDSLGCRHCPICGSAEKVTRHKADTFGPRAPVLASREEAEAWCDARLVEAGWVLATEGASDGG